MERNRNFCIVEETIDLFVVDFPNAGGIIIGDEHKYLPSAVQPDPL